MNEKDIKDILVAIDVFVIKHPEIRAHKDFGSLLRDLQVEVSKLTAELARRDEIITRLVEDGERLADNYIAAKRMICACFVADYQDDEIITLHRALIKELE